MQVQKKPKHLPIDSIGHSHNSAIYCQGIYYTTSMYKYIFICLSWLFALVFLCGKQHSTRPYLDTI